ncbi:MFS transporter [Intrasporangium sp. DVR]|uniref:MFS transporter n=1 Tax=Intrasporangium sp. DVR TaxID=3127867 RepID=UPI00313A5807
MEHHAKPGRPIGLVCLAILGLVAAQQMVNPVLPPLARQLGLSEVALGAVWTVGGAGIVLASPAWGRLIGRWGHRRVLLVSLGAAGVALLVFAAVAQAGLVGALALAPLFGLLLLTRGVVFGVAWAGTPVAAQSFVAESTSGEAQRVRGFSLIAAAQGLGMAVGPAIGGGLSGFGLLAPLYVAPVVLLAVALVVARGMPRSPAARDDAGPRSVHVGPRDRRVRPFLVTAFVMYLSLALVLMTVGFLVQDRLGLDPQETGRSTALVMLAGATAMILVQGVVVPRLAWGPPRLIRVGSFVMAAGMSVILVAHAAGLIAAGLAVVGAGIGLGAPGFMSMPTLLVTAQEQDSVAGLMNSGIALAMMLAPLFGTILYAASPAAPYLVGLILLVALAGFALVDPALRAPSATDHPLTVNRR